MKVSKKQILKKIRILITQKFDNPETAFKFFDKNADGYLEKGELKELIKSAEINSFLSGIVSKKMIQGLDQDQNQKFDWREFKKAVSDLITDVD